MKEKYFVRGWIVIMILYFLVYGWMLSQNIPGKTIPAYVLLSVTIVYVGIYLYHKKNNTLR